MEIVPNHISLKSLFSQYIFRVPKYQRTYAWTQHEVKDFLDDLGNCFMARVKSGQARQHFFGGIVSIGELGLGEKIECELVDGQQRLATIVLLASNMICAYQDIQRCSGGGNEIDKICKTRIARLQEAYISFDHEINRKFVTTNRLELSGADRTFFTHLTKVDVPPESQHERDSHKNLYSARNQIDKALQKELQKYDDYEKKLDVLEQYELLLQDDFSVLHMLAKTRNDAYRLFQVLNDRGKNLSSGDLLRAKSLEYLESYQEHQEAAIPYWDSILMDSPTETQDFLKWYYASHVGKRPRQARLLEDFFKNIFHQDMNLPTSTVKTEESARDLIGEIRNMQAEVIVCRQLLDGEWPYDSAQPVTSWQRSRLQHLILHLRHTNCVPLLLAAKAKLDHRKFAQIILLLERFAFRYINMCKAHATKLNNEYLKQAKKIRDHGEAYNLSGLQKALAILEKENASDDVFSAALNSLRYNERNTGVSNKPIKYLFIAIESYYRWQQDGAPGSPICSKDHVIIDFPDSTIEHIYPRSAQGQDVDHDLEPLKNTLGNLTLLGADNALRGNEGFEKKKEIYRDCVITMDHELSNHNRWDTQKLGKRQELLVTMALDIFSMTNRT